MKEFSDTKLQNKNIVKEKPKIRKIEGNKRIIVAITNDYIG